MVSWMKGESKNYLVIVNHDAFNEQKIYIEFAASGTKKLFYRSPKVASNMFDTLKGEVGSTESDAQDVEINAAGVPNITIYPGGVYIVEWTE